VTAILKVALKGAYRAILPIGRFRNDAFEIGGEAFDKMALRRRASSLDGVAPKSVCQIAANGTQPLSCINIGPTGEPSPLEYSPLKDEASRDYEWHL